MKTLYLGRTGRNVSEDNQLDIDDTVDSEAIEVVVEARYSSTGFCRVITAGASIHQLKYSYKDPQVSNLSRAGKGTIHYTLERGQIAQFESVVRSYVTARWVIALDAEGKISELTAEEVKAVVHGFSNVEAYQSAIEREDAERKEKAIESGLPELSGSEKQIRWALAIREKLLKKKSLAETAASKTSAKWFIDNRFAA